MKSFKQLINLLWLIIVITAYAFCVIFVLIEPIRMLAGCDCDIMPLYIVVLVLVIDKLFELKSERTILFHLPFDKIGIMSILFMTTMCFISCSSHEPITDYECEMRSVKHNSEMFNACLEYCDAVETILDELGVDEQHQILYTPMGIRYLNAKCKLDSLLNE